MTDLPDGWIDAGPVADLPDGGCAAAADARVLLIRHGDTVIGFQNRCLHKDTPLHDGHITAGTLICPLHHWRYDLRNGRVVGGTSQLPPVPVQLRAGRVTVKPPPRPPTSISALLHEHARSWSRETASPRSHRASLIERDHRPGSHSEETP